jgi:hypothetical protein
MGFLIRWIYQKIVYEIMSVVDLKEAKYCPFIHVSHISKIQMVSSTK